MDWTALIAQIPLVAAFIWYSEKSNRGFMDALDKRDQLYEARNKALCESIAQNTEQLAKLTELLIRQDERGDPPTQPRKR